MPVLNSDIARNLGKLADLIELEGGNPFRIRAYRNAARMSRSSAAPGSVGLSMAMASAMIRGLLPVFLVSVLGARALAVSAIEGVAKAMTLQWQRTWSACLGGAQTPGDPFVWSRR